MIKVYFEIFGKKLVKELDDEFKNMTDAQIEYWLRGKIKIDKIDRGSATGYEPEISDVLKDIFGLNKHT